MMPYRQLALILVPLVAAALVAVQPAAAATDPGVACASTKLKAATKKLSDKVKCHVKALKKNIPVEVECLTKAETKFEAAFAKAEAKGGCVAGSMSDAASIEALIDQTLADLLAALPATAPVACDVIAQDCPPISSGSQGCYASVGYCGGQCLPAGSNTQGMGCTQMEDCAPGYGCFYDSLAAATRCFKYCETICFNGLTCGALSFCTAEDLRVCF